MRPTLKEEVRAFLFERGVSTAPEIALGVRARRDDVDELLSGEGFTQVERPEGSSPRSVFFNVSQPVPSPQGGKSRATVMLAVLRDGRRHSREDIFRATGRYFLTNNAAAELRAQGHDVRHARQGRLDVYWLNAPATAALGATRARRVSGPATIRRAA